MENRNTLFPIFLKLQGKKVLIIGGGMIGEEKLTTLLRNSPSTIITILAKEILPSIQKIAESTATLSLIKKEYHQSDLEGFSIVIAAVNDEVLATQIANDCNEKGILINAADKPSLCDFYLGSVVTKGNLKIAISTNGTSPTLAKRLKEYFNEIIPDDIEDLMLHLQAYRKSLKADFEQKIALLNEHTKALVEKEFKRPKDSNKWQEVVKYCLIAFFSMIIGHALLSFFPLWEYFGDIQKNIGKIDLTSFSLMLLAGFLAQMADGSLGMGYGTISTTFLLAIGVHPAVVSSRVHSARVFSSGVSGYSHHKFGNINKKLFKALVFPGIAGAIAGAALCVYAKDYARIVKIPLSVYTIYLGYYIIRKAYKKKIQNEKVSKVGWLATAGSFLDAFAGGGWGALVTSTLISKRKQTRYVIGSVCLAEFFVVFSSALTFLVLLNHIPLFDVIGLILGGVFAAPIAARLAGRMPVKKVLAGVGLLVVATSLNTLVKAVLDLIKLYS